VFSQVDRKRRGRHRTLVADLANDVSHICSFAGRDASLLDNKEEFNHNCSLFVGQAGDLAASSVPAVPYLCHLVPAEAPQQNALSPLG